MNNIEFVGIVSSAGGAGVTSLSRTLARILKRQSEDENLKILCLGFDSLSSKMAPKNIEKKSVKRLLTRIVDSSCEFESLKDSFVSSDEFGVFYLADSYFYNPLNSLSQEELNLFLNYLSQSDQFDYVILDIPLTGYNSMQQAACCEKIVVCKGYLKSQIEVNDRLFSSIEKYIKGLSEKPRLYSFTCLEDRESFLSDDVDIHGQYAAEVREFASQLFSDI